MNKCIILIQLHNNIFLSMSNPLLSHSSTNNLYREGDHYVTMDVEIPKSLSKEEEELVQQLRELKEKKGKKKGLFQ